MDGWMDGLDGAGWIVWPVGLSSTYICMNVHIACTYMGSKERAGVWMEGEGGLEPYVET